MDYECVSVREQAAGLDRSAADGDDARLAPVERRSDELRLELAERSLALRLEQVPDRPFRTLDLVVDVVERPPQPFGDLAAERRLARAHEADEDEVAV